jgi:hypothetical protein
MSQVASLTIRQKSKPVQAQIVLKKFTVATQVTKSTCTMVRSDRGGGHDSRSRGKDDRLDRDDSLSIFVVTVAALSMQFNREPQMGRNWQRCVEPRLRRREAARDCSQVQALARHAQGSPGERGADRPARPPRDD